MSETETDITLAVAACDACGALAVWPRHACLACGGTAFATRLARGDGLIHSLTIVHRPPASGGATPEAYALALIELAIGGRLMARVPLSGRIGDAVIAHRTDRTKIPEVTFQRSGR